MPAGDETPAATDARDEAAAQERSLEPPTGRRAVRGPTAFVLGMMLAVALAAIARRCLA